MWAYYSRSRLAARQLRQLFYPRRCPFCGRVVGSLPVCPDCAQQREALLRRPSFRLDPAKHYFGRIEQAAAPFRYEGSVRRSILRAKYQGAPWVAAELGVWMARLLTDCEIQMVGAEPVPQASGAYQIAYDCVVPVPPSGRSRGYNVPTQMACPLSKAMGLPMEPDALKRIRSGTHQAGLPLEMRLINVAGAFRAQKREVIEGSRVLLVDDVITTGATAAACAKALLDAGAQSVSAFALAAVEFSATPPALRRITEDEWRGEWDDELQF